MRKPVLVLAPVVLCAAILLFLSAPAPAGNSIDGVVIDVLGQPVPGARVTVLSSTRTQTTVIGKTVSGEDGGFHVSYPASPPSVLHRSTYIVASSDRLLGVEVVTNRDAGQRVVCRPKSGISGKVVDADGIPIAGAVVKPEFFITDAFFGQQYVDFRKIETALGIEPALTDERGEFTLQGLPSGWNACLHASAKGFADGLTGGADAASDTIIPESALPVGITNAVITLNPGSNEPSGGRIKGRVVHKATHEPMPNTVVVAANAGDHESGYRQEVLAASDGAFEFSGLPDGEYVVTTAESDVPVQPILGIPVLNGDTAQVVLYAEKGITVGGRVVDAKTGEPVPGVMVVAPGIRPAVTSAGSILGRGAGEFSVEMLPGAGVLSVEGDDVGYANIIREVEVPTDGDLTDIEIKLPRVASIAGVVKNTSGKPVDGALLRVIAGDGPSGTLQSDSRGRYSYTPLMLPSQDPKCYVVAYDPSTGEAAMSTVNLRDGRETRLDIALEAAASVSGIIRDSNGKPIAGARVLPALQTGRNRIYSMHSRTTSDSDGRFTIRGLIPGAAYFARIEAAGHGSLPTGKDSLPELQSGKTATVEFVLPEKTDGSAR